ncbi:glycine betaine ABC transporter substrate-binding protein [Sansalvadorimonas verongulae]|uniref:glycine betaine ABC transporter substrate-binding protein n=1 Tax=Sansalvadorimonas verongulae TaxID=2172824 RepID=UPI0012BC5C43|nr:glycine betaine ABC transporter substrate-binding protein [Sansalvadorimonas verongulae]MTI15513.1 ABC transporter substrate-binding protein [Sansalvadorimonas verongulae]
MKRFTTFTLATLFSLFISASLYADHKHQPSSRDDGSCGSLEVADMNWNSASFVAHVDQFILEHGFGCEATLVLGNTKITGASLLSESKPEVVPEFWGNAVREELAEAVQEQKIRYGRSPFIDGAIEAFWVPAYMVESTPELATIAGIKKNAHLFPSTSEKPFPFYGCPKGWICHTSSRNIFKALELDKANFEFTTPPTGADLDASLQEAYDSKAPWFGYYWSPTAIMGRYKMVKVDFGVGVDEQEFKNCSLRADCPNPKVTMFPAPMVQTIVASEFAERAPKAFQYLSRRGWTNDQMNEILAWMDDNQADGLAAMEHFLRNYQSIWVRWVDGKTVRSVRKALDEF